MSSQENFAERESASTCSEDLISRVDIAEFNDGEDYQSLTTSAVLFHCKRKILRPYLRLLAVMGLRPFCSDSPQVSMCVSVFGYFHVLQVIVFMISGYVLQYMACFRRDRGFCYATLPLTKSLMDDHSKICYGSVVFSYIIPSVLHFGAYLYVLVLIRFKGTEQFETLMERTFLLSAHRPGNPSQQKGVVRNLWIYICFSIIWMLLSFSTVLIMISEGNIVMQWVEEQDFNKLKIFLEIILIVSTLWHDMVQATIITSYCLQVQLLISNLYFLRAKLLHHTLQPLQWVREIVEFQNLLNYLNNDFAPSVCVFTFINMSWAGAGVLWLLNLNVTNKTTPPICIFNVLLWVLMASVPFIMASRLSAACSMLRSLGHEVRTRPFVYKDTPGEDLDTILLYTSSLRMKAKLFKVPIIPKYLFLLLFSCSVIVFTLGQCHVLINI